MTKSGVKFIFDIDKVSLVDINDLIDKGVRFTLEEGLKDTEYDEVEECLADDSI